MLLASVQLPVEPRPCSETGELKVAPENIALVLCTLPSPVNAAVRARSPSKTWIVTAGWLSACVEKVCAFLVGTVVCWFHVNLFTSRTCPNPNRRRRVPQGAHARFFEYDSSSAHHAPEWRRAIHAHPR